MIVSTTARTIRRQTIQYALRAFLLLAAVASLVGAPFQSAPASQGLPRVLVLFSYHPGFPSSEPAVAGLRSVLNGVAKLDIEYMDSKRIHDQVSIENLDRLMRYKLAARPAYDLVVVADDNALEFVQARRESVFGGAPVVFFGVNNIEAAMQLNAHPQITGVVEKVSIPETIRMMRKLIPRLKRVIGVVDNTASGRGDLAAFQALGREVAGVRLEVLRLSEHSWAEMDAKLAVMPSDTAILRLAGFKDRLGVVRSSEHIVARWSEVAAVPLLALREHDIDYGAFGGVVVTFTEQGKRAGQLAKAILSGISPAELTVSARSPNVAVFNFQGLQRFKIPADSLPAYAEVRGGPVDTIWNYLTLILGCLALALIFGVLALRLFMQVNVRKQAEASLRESENRLRTFVDNAPEAILLIAVDPLRIVDANENAIELFGWPRETLIGMNPSRLMPERQSDDSDSEKAMLEMAHRVMQGVRAHFERDYQNADGEVLSAEVRLIRLPSSERPLMRASITDISEVREARSALIEKTRQVEATLENADQGILMVNADLELVASNSRLCQLLDIPEACVESGTPMRKLLRRLAERGDLGEGQADSLVERALRHAIPTEPQSHSWNILNGTVLEVRINPISGGGAVYTYTDLTELHQLSQRLFHQARHDALTGLLNRHAFEQSLRAAIESANDSGETHAMCYLDLDQFKVINDTCGHVAGDELLRQLGHVLQEQVRRGDVLARLGGDEFAVLLENCPLNVAENIVNTLCSAITEFKFGWEDRCFRVGVSAGLVPIHAGSGDVAEVLSSADTACYAAKDQGRNRVHVSHPDDDELVLRQGEMHWVLRIQQALEESRFSLMCQPIKPSTKDAKSTHYELLVRMYDEDGSFVSPGAFIPAAERYQLMGQVDRWVVANAFDMLSECREFVDQASCIAINLSGQSLIDEELPEFIRSQLEVSGLPPEKLCFEVTETAAITNLGQARRFFHQVGSLGCSFALDDFGSGLSSFGYLKNLPVDYLKIDGLFVKDIVDDPIDEALVRSINELGHVMGKKTIAEFVESEEIAEALMEIGVDYVQGFAIGHPRPFAEVLAEHQIQDRTPRLRAVG